MSNSTLTGSDDGRTIEVKTGDEISIRLEENPTTGYRWAVEQMDESILELQNSDYEKRQDSAIGGGGERRLTFRARQAGTTRLLLKNQREWEKDNPLSQYSVTVTVAD